MTDALSTVTDRRTSRYPANLTPRELVEAQLRAAQCQLAQARESLIAARRRVVQLEDAVSNWTEFSRMAAVTPPTSN